MSKELSPLEALKKIGKLKVEGIRVIPEKPTVSDYVYYYIVEKALIRLEVLDSENIIILDNETLDVIAIGNNSLKKLKVLEIIKEKWVDVGWLIQNWKNGFDSLEDYNDNHLVELTQEEYDLLKEVLL